MIDFSLSAHDLTTSGSVGLRRHSHAIWKQQKPADGAEENSEPVTFEHDLISAMSEFAVAKVYNLFWDPNIGRNDNRDVGGCLDVRARRANGSGLDLVIKPRDVKKAPDVPFVLVHCFIPKFRLAGWLYPKEVTDKEREAVWSDQRGIWFVPVGKIRKIETLRPLLPKLWLAAGGYDEPVPKEGIEPPTPAPSTRRSTS